MTTAGSARRWMLLPVAALAASVGVWVLTMRGAPAIAAAADAVTTAVASQPDEPGTAPKLTATMSVQGLETAAPAAEEDATAEAAYRARIADNIARLEEQAAAARAEGRPALAEVREKRIANLKRRLSVLSGE